MPSGACMCNICMVSCSFHFFSFLHSHIHVLLQKNQRQGLFFLCSFPLRLRSWHPSYSYVLFLFGLCLWHKRALNSQLFSLSGPPKCGNSPLIFRAHKKWALALRAAPRFKQLHLTPPAPAITSSKLVSFSVATSKTLWHQTLHIAPTDKLSEQACRATCPLLFTSSKLLYLHHISVSIKPSKWRSATLCS